MRRTRSQAGAEAPANVSLLDRDRRHLTAQLVDSLSIELRAAAKPLGSVEITSPENVRLPPMRTRYSVAALSEGLVGRVAKHVRAAPGPWRSLRNRARARPRRYRHSVSRARFEVRRAPGCDQDPLGRLRALRARRAFPARDPHHGKAQPSAHRSTIRRWDHAGP